MIEKKNLWFLTLFGIILVMSIYYISLPNSDAGLVGKEISKEIETNASVSESSHINALRVSRDETLEKEVNGIREILMDESKSTEEKSDAYEALKSLNMNKGKEEDLENTLKKNFNYSAFVSIDGDNIKVVIDAPSHSFELANKIIKEVQKEFNKKVYITVSFGTV